MAVDYLSEYHKISWNTKSKLYAELAQGVYSNDLKNGDNKQGVSVLGVQLVREYANAPKFCGANSLKQKSIIDGHKLLLAKPLTYMNLSGKAVQAICSYYNIKTPNIFVVHDDIDLPIGRIKYKLAGSSGGHNGLKSLDQHVGNDYHRIRIGVGRPAAYDDVSDYVLGAFSKEEYKTIISSIAIITNNFHLLLSGKVEEFNRSVV
ncbi:MAG: aminoacyl-tRNA hydrolase [Rickettsia endosymbiont of Pseudomimeciton antennatum]|nr:aminoacyl-tRNA hydrolase [Rickettsia endosymbiont of Pseudomimeciton antennatum]MCC8398567.1 aminoacyl-tRNA hydrolase [Rickettsia endosymbiont of Labidopullus appendiculatus]